MTRWEGLRLTPGTLCDRSKPILTALGDSLQYQLALLLMASYTQMSHKPGVRGTRPGSQMKLTLCGNPSWMAALSASLL